jgi:hypothetical protein
MWTTLILMTALAADPEETGQLQLTNDRLTYGMMGAERSDNQFLPGDFLAVAFDIEHLKTDAFGKALYNIGMEIKDAKGKRFYAKDPEDMKVYLSLGGGRLPAFAAWPIEADTPPGEYTLKLTVTDKGAKKSKSLTHPFEVMPKKFGLIRLHTLYNSPGLIPAPPVAAAGQAFIVNFSATEFGRDKNKDPSVSVEMRVYDDKNQPTLAKPFTGGFDGKSDVPKNLDTMDMQFLLQLNRSGKYTVKLKATDKTNTKTADLAFKITVLEPR